jgi:hypothetical protein
MSTYASKEVMCAVEGDMLAIMCNHKRKTRRKRIPHGTGKL